MNKIYMHVLLFFHVCHIMCFEMTSLQMKNKKLRAYHFKKN